jgi:hypothetical protein
MPRTVRQVLYHEGAKSAAQEKFSTASKRGRPRIYVCFAG